MRWGNCLQGWKHRWAEKQWPLSPSSSLWHLIHGGGGTRRGIGMISRVIPHLRYFQAHGMICHILHVLVRPQATGDQVRCGILRRRLMTKSSTAKVPSFHFRFSSLIWHNITHFRHSMGFQANSLNKACMWALNTLDLFINSSLFLMQKNNVSQAIMGS